MPKPVGIPKPPACQGCPMYGDGYGYVPDELVADARVAIVAQNPGETEEREGRPLVGQTGQTMDREYFPIGSRVDVVQLERGRVHLLNVLKCRWQPQPGGPKTNVLPPVAMRKRVAAQCMDAHFRLPDVELVVATGALAVESLGGPGAVSIWRGFTWMLPEGIVRRLER